MSKKILVICFLFFINSIYAVSLVVKADKSYTNGNLSALGIDYNANPKNQVVSYLYAKAMLTKNISTYADWFITNSPDSYMRNDLIHQLMIFNFTNNNYLKFIKLYNLLNTNQLSLNEKCGYDYSLIVTKSSGKKNNDVQWLIKNNIPNWCVQLIALNYNNGKISKDEVNIALINLILNGRTDLFNSNANRFNLKPINFGARVNNFRDRSQFDFVEAYRIYSLAHKNPPSGYTDLKNAKIDALTRNILGTYVAMQFALKHDFNMALNLYDKYDQDYLSNEELEWKVRSYMFNSKWSNVIDTIDTMPDNLKTKNVWLYWRGKANAYLGDNSNANSYYKKIPNDYSYYSMLANAELGNNTEYLIDNPKAIALTSSTAANNAKLAMDLYLTGKANNSKNLMNIATAEWNYAAKMGSNKERLAMSDLALKNNLYDLAIFAGNQLQERYMLLSFPTPFLKAFQKYANENGIDPAYALAIARQESRFNAKAIAFDGGVGLMQLMPQTAKYISRKSRSSNCYKTFAECNIKFGSWYLGNLSSVFNKDLIYSTAAYNAGPGRAKRWQDVLGKLDNIVEIELIPIQITRDYVQKVLSNKAIYDAKFSNASSINLISFIEKISQTHYANEGDDNTADTGRITN